MKASITINSEARNLVIQGRHLTVFSVSVGKPETPTPTGVFYIHSKWEKGDHEVEEHGKCLGSHCLTLGQYANGSLQPVGKDEKGNLQLVSEDDICFAIHGTDDPDRIGGAVGEGCVRMYNSEIELLYNWVDVGDVVVII